MWQLFPKIQVILLPHFPVFENAPKEGCAGEAWEGEMSHRRTTLKAFANSRKLRRDQTPAETKLWQALRAHQAGDVHFRRQHAIGNYIVDFCSPRQKLVIEVDGSQHLEQVEYDNRRTAFLESKGYRVLRFWNDDVMKNLEGVMIVILEALES
jgi:very-short-patch-repair endonuclease